MNIPFQQVLPFTYDDSYTPWFFPTPRVCEKLAQVPKGSMPTPALRASFSNHLSAHESSVAVYTDGSKSEFGV